jgi:hypothetical protein
MAYNVFFTISGAGSDTGPFNISGTTNTGTVVLIQSNVAKATLEGGYEVTISNDNITGGTIQSVGTCTTSQPWEKPSMWLSVYARDVGTFSAALLYSVSTDGGNTYGSTVPIPDNIPASCTNHYTIVGLAQGDYVKFTTLETCVMSGADNTTSCPTQSGSNVEYITTINTPSPDSVAITVNSSIIP